MWAAFAHLARQPPMTSSEPASYEGFLEGNAPLSCPHWRSARALLPCRVGRMRDLDAAPRSTRVPPEPREIRRGSATLLVRGFGLARGPAFLFGSPISLRALQADTA